MKFEYPHHRRITLRADFEKVSKEGRRIRVSDLDARSLASPLGYIRVGLIVPRHGQSAVHRNQLKRRLRELTRVVLLPLELSRDVTLTCRASAYGRTFVELQERVLLLRDRLLEAHQDVQVRT